MIRAHTTLRNPHRKIRTFTAPDGEAQFNAPDDLRVSVELWDDAYDLPVRLYFAGPGADAQLVGLEFGSEAHPGGNLTAKQIGHVGRQLPIYEKYARAQLAMALDPGKAQELRDALSVSGSSRRGKSAAFYREVGEELDALMAAGDKAPITTIAKRRGVNKSTASRWVQQARILKRAGSIEVI